MIPSTYDSIDSILHQKSVSLISDLSESLGCQAPYLWVVTLSYLWTPANLLDPLLAEKLGINYVYVSFFLLVSGLRRLIS